jgi:hypothetical protein
MSFVRFFRNQLWLSFWLVNREIKVFSGKSKFEGEECLLLHDEHIIVFCVFTFRVDYEMYSCVRNEKYFCLKKKTEQFVVHFKINTTSWVLHVTKNVRCFCFGFTGCTVNIFETNKYLFVLLISTMICFAFFFWWEEWQVLDGVTVLGHFQHRDWLFGNAS